MKGRIETIARIRSDVAELQAKHGLALGQNGGIKDSLSLYKDAGRLGMTRLISTPPKTVILCAAELSEGRKANPCLIVPSALPIELLPPHKLTAVGGEVLSISRTPFALPKYIMDAAWRAHGSWQGELMPVLVSINSEYRYLVRPNSYFFRWERFTGDDLDASSPGEPNEVDLKLGRYHWGDDLTNRLTVVVADF